MRIEKLLAQLDRVKPTRRGWTARCPAHQDQSPSLAIRETDDGRILVHCFAGCSATDICTALGIRLADLFPDAQLDHRAWREAQQRREVERTKRDTQDYVDGLVIDARREAEKLITSAREIDISGWSEKEVDSALGAMAEAYAVLQEEMVTYGN